MPTASDMIEVTRAWRVTLGPTKEQEQLLARHAGAARWAYNLALSAKVAAREVWEQRVQALVDSGMPEPEAKKAVKVKTPGAQVIDKARVRVRGTDQRGNPCVADWADAHRVMIDGGIDDEVADLVLTRWAERVDDPEKGIAPWLNEVPNGLVQRGEKNADAAWKSWLDSFAGRRAGRRVGFPRFKKKGDRDSFYLTNTEAGPVPGSNRHVRLGGKLGVVKVVDADGKRALRRMARHARRGDLRVMSVTVSRGGHRWYASILTSETVPAPHPTRRATTAGTVGVHVGVRERATLSTGETIDNPRVKETHTRALTKAQRVLSRTGWVTDDNGRKRPTRRREKARKRVARLSHLETLRRATHTHHLSKRLATDWAEVVMLDLGVQDMTKSSKRSRPRLHGWDAQTKRDANRAMLDIAPYDLRQQVAYKTAKYGATLTVVPRGTTVTGICPQCGTVKPKRPQTGRSNTPCSCGATFTRGHAAALILATHGAAACNKREAQNARGEDIRPDGPRAGRQSSVKREGPRPPRGSPSSGNAGAFPTTP